MARNREDNSIFGTHHHGIFNWKAVFVKSKMGALRRTSHALPVFEHGLTETVGPRSDGTDNMARAQNEGVISLHIGALNAAHASVVHHRANRLHIVGHFGAVRAGRAQGLK